MTLKKTFSPNSTIQPKAEAPTILLVGDFSASKVGNESVAEDLVRRLKRRNYKLVTTSAKTGRLSRVVDMVLTTWQQRSKVDIASVDVFSGNAFLWAEVVSGILQLARVPYVLVLHGGALPTFAKRHPKRVARLLRSARRVITPSTYLAEEMRDYLSEYALIPNPLDLSQYPFVLREQAAPKLVWLRSFHSIYNPALAVRVVARLAKQFPDVSLTMVGPDRGDGSLERTQQLAAELGVLGRVTFVGPVPKAEVPKWLASGDVFLNTTRIDNTPVSLLEAMACGLCVVSTSVGGIPYLVAEGENALLVPSDDEAAMASAVSDILTQPDLAQHLSTSARRLTEAFDWGTVLPQWETLFKEVAQEKVS